MAQIYKTGGTGKNYVYNPDTGNISVNGKVVKPTDSIYQTTIDAANADTGGAFSKTSSPTQAVTASQGEKTYQPVVPSQTYESPYSDTIASLLDTVTSGKTYNSPYSDTIDALLNTVLDPGEFSYDYNSDPTYQSLLQTAQREGSRAAEDTMGTYAGMTGGLPSTAAVSAAQQAQNYQLSKVQDAIPTLYAAAYGRWQDQQNSNINKLSALQGIDNTQYGRWQDEQNNNINVLNELIGLDTDAYGRYRDTVSDYMSDQQYQDLLAQQELENSMAKDETAYNRILALLDMGLTTDQTASILGLSQDQVNQYANLVKQGQQIGLASDLATLNKKTSSSGSSGSSSSGGTDYTKDVLYSSALSMWKKNGTTADDIRQYLEDKGASEDRIKGIMDALGITYTQKTKASVADIPDINKAMSLMQEVGRAAGSDKTAQLNYLEKISQSGKYSEATIQYVLNSLGLD